MRKHIITFLILLMTALPVWSATTVCHHVKALPQTMDRQASDHHCCLEQQGQPAGQMSADTCHCDQLQHVQFILSLPMLPAAVPPDNFILPTSSLLVFPEPAGVPYRPPIT